MNTLEPAKKEEAGQCARILGDGREFQKEQGFVQWTENYPNLDTVCEDIKAQKGYVLKVDEKLAGYMCIDFSGEPAYTDIKGAWRAQRAYAVVRRIAFSKEFIGIGLADIAFKLIEKVCLDNKVPYIRINTGFSNRRMQHILEKNGFVQCGVVVLQGGEKIAYDKLL
ncbi:GNAT family N-acetyltransferase [Allofournierella sp.]|uniref:GNAT family N-acetyltransferase n=1 Tax=Allofournierella sp. TaxID=1940256 RepID=UPI003AB5B4D4